MLDWETLGALGIRLPDQQAGQLDTFHQMLLEKNQRMDLTNVPPEDMAIRHYADSLLILHTGLLEPGAKLIDVGSGAGFPGLPLAIARPDLGVTLLESKQKRCAFLMEVLTRLQLGNVQVLCGRAEDLAVSPRRESFDHALARAVAPLNELAEYLLPYVRVGGSALCWKGPAVLQEQAAGQAAARLLGGEIGELVNLGIPGRSHFIQVIKKTRATPTKYPRKAGTPAKDPLG